MVGFSLVFDCLNFEHDLVAVVSSSLVAFSCVPFSFVLHSSQKPLFHLASLMQTVWTEIRPSLVVWHRCLVQLSSLGLPCCFQCVGLTLVPTLAVRLRCSVSGTSSSSRSRKLALSVTKKRPWASRNGSHLLKRKNSKSQRATTRRNDSAGKSLVKKRLRIKMLNHLRVPLLALQQRWKCPRSSKRLL